MHSYIVSDPYCLLFLHEVRLANIFQAQLQFTTCKCAYSQHSSSRQLDFQPVVNVLA